MVARIYGSHNDGACKREDLCIDGKVHAHHLIDLDSKVETWGNFRPCDGGCNNYTSDIPREVKDRIEILENIINKEVVYEKSEDDDERRTFWRDNSPKGPAPSLATEDDIRRVIDGR
ncbi:MAG TPA: hypothetical protein P5323_00545 [Candidatus Moranbacteria bacterium]|nr:hypothetical protein [Candidatus Moranbacteria bacterium]HRY27603.1 hypothetical protein [Candidatus Moranbacteria bacterium]HSA07832.1 hypothetical protein [Candidatus Moranbacteria bacterium]